MCRLALSTKTLIRACKVFDMFWSGKENLVGMENKCITEPQ